MLNIFEAVTRFHIFNQHQQLWYIMAFYCCFTSKMVFVSLLDTFLSSPPHMPCGVLTNLCGDRGAPSGLKLGKRRSFYSSCFGLSFGVEAAWHEALFAVEEAKAGTTMSRQHLFSSKSSVHTPSVAFSVTYLLPQRPVIFQVGGVVDTKNVPHKSFFWGNASLI